MIKADTGTIIYWMINGQQYSGPYIADRRYAGGGHVRYTSIKVIIEQSDNGVSTNQNTGEHGDIS